MRFAMTATVLALVLAVAAADRHYQKQSHSMHATFLRASPEKTALGGNNSTQHDVAVSATVADPDVAIGRVGIPSDAPIRQEAATTTPAPVATTTAAPVTTTEAAVITNKSALSHRRDFDIKEVVITWVVLAVATIVMLKVMKGSTWNPKRRSPYVAAMLILWTIVAFSTCFYFLSTHDWSWLECVYFSVVTVTTVGYGDYVPYDSTLDSVLLLVFLWFNMFVLSLVLSIVVNAEDQAIEGSQGKGLYFHLAFMVGLVLGGALLFSTIEGWTFIEGIFFTTVTLTTVGYGHLLPNSGPLSLVCAIAFILIGVPIAGCFVGSFSSAIDEKIKKFKLPLGAYAAIIIAWLLVGATIFHQMNSHGWTWAECLYFAAVTMTTVGYGDYVPTKTNADRILCIVYIWSSVVFIAAIFGDFTGLLIKAVTDKFDKEKEPKAHRHKAIMVQLGMLGTVVIAGIALFSGYEGWSLLRGFTFTSVTCTTVGYGHYLPASDEAKLICVPFLLLAVPLTGALVGNISDSYSDEITTLIADIDE